MAVGNSGVSSRSRLAIAAVSTGAVAVVALAVLAFGPRGAITASPVAGATKTLSPNSSVARGASQAEAIAKARGMVGSMATYFEVNQGQTHPSVKYLSRSVRIRRCLTSPARTLPPFGDPSVTTCKTRPRKWPAIARASTPPRLWPMSAIGSVLPFARRTI